MADERNLLRIAIRKKLDEFTISGIDNFCFDYFYAHSQELDKVQDKQVKIRSLIRYVNDNNQLNNLQDLLKINFTQAEADLNEPSIDSKNFQKNKNKITIEKIDALKKIEQKMTDKSNKWEQALNDLRNYVKTYKKEDLKFYNYVVLTQQKLTSIKDKLSKDADDDSLITNIHLKLLETVQEKIELN